MVASNYADSIRRVLKWEGGYVNHPSDPGGPTNFGITLAVYRANGHPTAGAEDVRRMQVGEAMEIYRQKYARPIAFDLHKAGIDYSLLDYAVNSGVSRANKVARRVCGLPDNAPFAELQTAIGKRDPKAVVTAINAERLKFLQGLPTWPTFGRGWSNRVNGVKAAALAMAANTALNDVAMPAEPVPGKGEVPKPDTGKVVVGTGAGGAAGGGFGFGEWISAHPFWSVLIAAAGLVALIVISEYVAHRIKAARQDAPVPIEPVPELAH